MFDSSWDFELTDADRRALDRVGEIVNGYRLMVDEEATEFYRSIKLTKVPTPEESERLAEIRGRELLEESRLEKWDNIRKAKVPKEDVVFAPVDYSIGSRMMRKLSRGIIKNACLQTIPSRWWYAPVDFSENIFTMRGDSDISLWCIDGMGKVCYHKMAYEILRDVMDLRQAQGRVTVFTVALPFSDMEDHWAWSILENKKLKTIR